MRGVRTNTILLALAVTVMATMPLDLHLVVSPPPPSDEAVLNELGFLDHIDHIVFVVLENHPYDNYFGTYCLETSTVCPQAASGIPSGACVPYTMWGPLGPCIHPWSFTAKNWTITSDLPHSYEASRQSWDNGAMDGFYQAEESGLDPFGHYNGTTAPIYWDLAEEYTLSDSFFSSVLSYSLPNHWHIVAGRSPQIAITTDTRGCSVCAANVVVRDDHLYLDEANHTDSIEDLLLHTHVSWKYYDFTLGTYANAIDIDENVTSNRIDSTGSAFDLWNPQAAKAESYDSSFIDHFVPNTQFYNDTRNGTLPSLSWVIPPGQDSDHPPNNSTLAQTWLASVIDAIESSPDWNTTAVYVTWDDYGGFWDNVPPPIFEGQQLGFRVPLIIISPYTEPGTVVNSMGFFESVLHLMEWRFDLGCITELDCNAPLPVWGFDWNQTPRGPILFPTNFSQAGYPYAPDWNGTPAVATGSYYPPAEFTYFPDGEAPDVD